MIAIVSDIHANIEAFTVVRADMVERGVEEVICLGDIIGYGPNPRECIEGCKDARFALLGNHEEAVLFHAEDFNAKARRAIDWTRDQLNTSEDKEANYALWDYLGELKKFKEEGDTLYVHGSPRQPTRDYVLPNDSKDPDKMGEIFDGIERFCFCGHTHIPGVFFENHKFRYARQLENEFKIPNEGKVLINVGSVGQPRDHDNRSSYVTIDDGWIRWHRLEYDFEQTVAKIREIDDLADYLADRLKEGR